MIEAWALSIAKRIKKISPDSEASIEVMAYALGYKLSFYIIVLTTLLIGLATGRAWETLLCLVGFQTLRKVSGGYHFESLTACAVVSIVSLSILPHIYLNVTWTMILNGIAFVLVCWLAPAGIQKYTTIPDKHLPYLKAISILIVFSNFAIQSDVLALSLLFQAILLYPVKEVNTR